jgi:5-methylthioribose kinase
MTDEGHLYVIDGEFAHHGLPEFDLGVLTAHLHMAGTPPEQIEESLTYYDKPPGFDTNLANQFCQVEIIRRIIGIAQLPLSLSLEERQKLLSNARAALR